MKLKFLILISFIFSITMISQAQKRVGFVVETDSIIKYVHLGMTSFNNFSASYSLPFELNDYCETSTRQIFESSDMKLVKIDPLVYQGYLGIKRNLSKKEFKVFKEEWFRNLKKEYNIDALLVVHSAVLEPYQQENIETKLGQIAMIHENNKSSVRVFLQMEADFFVNGKRKSIKGETEILRKENYPGLRSKTTRYTEEEIALLEPVLKELILLQLEEIKGSKPYKKIISQ